MTPKFYKTNCHWFKVYSEEKCICVTEYLFETEIGIKHADLINIFENLQEISKQEFEQAYQTALTKLNKIYENNN